MRVGDHGKTKHENYNSRQPDKKYYSQVSSIYVLVLPKYLDSHISSQTFCKSAFVGSLTLELFIGLTTPSACTL